jgi:hypothetical protein
LKKRFLYQPEKQEAVKDMNTICVFLLMVGILVLGIFSVTDGYRNALKENVDLECSKDFEHVDQNFIPHGGPVGGGGPAPG